MQSGTQLLGMICPRLEIRCFMCSEKVDHEHWDHLGPLNLLNTSLVILVLARATARGSLLFHAVCLVAKDPKRGRLMGHRLPLFEAGQSCLIQGLLGSSGIVQRGSHLASVEGDAAEKSCVFWTRACPRDSMNMSVSLLQLSTTVSMGDGRGQSSSRFLQSSRRAGFGMRLAGHGWALDTTLQSSVKDWRPGFERVQASLTQVMSTVIIQ